MRNKALIDKYGEIDTQIKELKKEMEEVKGKLDITEAGVYEGDDYKITASEKVSNEYDTKKIFKVLGEKTFLHCCKVSVTAVKEFIAPMELQKYVSDTKISIALAAKKLK